MEALEKFFGKKEKQPEVHYNFQEIWELEKPTVDLVKQLKRYIDNGDFDLLISDETSARIPTLAMRKIINERNRVLHPEQKPEEREIKAVFIAGGVYPDIAEEQFQELNLQSTKKALIVTEFMSTGGHIDKLGESLERVGLNFDIAAVTARGDYRDYLRAFPEIFSRHQLFIGGYSNVPFIWASPDLSGVERDSHINIRPKVYRGRSANPEKIKKAREDADTLAKQVLKKVWG